MAGLLTIVDIQIERAVKAVFSGFGQDFQPAELEGEIRNIIKRNRTEFIEGSYVPNQFMIYLSQPDYEAFLPLKGPIIEDLTVCISKYIQESGNKVIGAEKGEIAGRIMIELRPDGKLKRGEVRIEPGFRR